MNGLLGACMLCAANSLRLRVLGAIRTGCADSPLAQNFNGGAELGALGMVRMVCMAFRALKTPESVLIADARSVGGSLSANPAEEQSKPNAVQGQYLGKAGADLARNECSSGAQWRAS